MTWKWVTVTRPLKNAESSFSSFPLICDSIKGKDIFSSNDYLNEALWQWKWWNWVTQNFDPVQAVGNVGQIFRQTRHTLLQQHRESDIYLSIFNKISKQTL